MFRQFIIVAITEPTSDKSGSKLRVVKTSEEEHTDNILKSSFREQFDSFNSKDEEDYYIANTGEAYSDDFNFMIEDYELPTWLERINSMSETAIERGKPVDLRHTATSGIIFLVNDTNYGEIMLFQNRSKANVIRPGGWIPLTEDRETYYLSKPDVLTFANKLTAVYFSEQKKLLFDNYSNASRFLPLEDFSNKIFHFHVDEVFAHKCVNDTNRHEIIKNSNSIIKRKFIKLNRMNTLYDFALDFLTEKAKKGGIEIPVHNGQIYFPPDVKYLDIYFLF